MADKRSYQTVEQSAKKFDELIAAMRKKGELMLPPERELAVLLGCSRGTARKLLERKVDAGVILKNSVGRTLSMATAVNRRRLGRFGFIAMGEGLIGNPAWAKLWMKLQAEAEDAGMQGELFLIPCHQERFDWEEMKKSLPKTLVVATLTKKEIDWLLKLEDKVFISTESHYAGIFENIVALDNVAAGRLAALELASHGCKRPAMVSDSLIVDGRPYVQYAKRIEGFSAGCREAGLPFDPEKDLFMLEGVGVKNMVSAAKRGMEIAKGPFDAVFLHTDINIDFLLEGLSSEGKRTPEDIGVITVNSFNIAISHDPPVNSIGHGTAQMAATLVKKLKDVFKGETRFGEIYETPEIHEGKTLRA